MTGTLGIGALECVTKGLAEGAPLSQDNKRLTKSALEVTFDLKSQGDFLSKSRKFAGKDMDSTDRAEFMSDLGKKWESARALTWTETASTFTEYFTSDGTTRGALARAEQRLETCELGGVGGELSGAVAAGRQSLTDARAAIRDSQRKMACIEKGWRKQYGGGWRQTVRMTGGGPAGQAYARHQAQVGRLRSEDPERIALLKQAGDLCGRLKQAKDNVDRARANYESSRTSARSILLGESCELARAEEALVSMEKLESGNCAAEVTGMPRDFIARGAPFASSALRPELARKTRECGEQKDLTFTGAADGAKLFASVDVKPNHTDPFGPDASQHTAYTYTKSTAKVVMIRTTCKATMDWTWKGVPTEMAPGQQITITISGEVKAEPQGCCPGCSPSAEVYPTGLEVVGTGERAAMGTFSTGGWHPKGAGKFVFRVPQGTAKASLTLVGDWGVGEVAVHKYELVPKKRTPRGIVI